MSEKKRKADTSSKDAPRKRAAVEGPKGVIKVHVAPVDGAAYPIITSSPGVSLPSKIGFQGYSNGPEVLLQSSDHPTIDFTATEDSRPDQAHLKHYVAVFDPKTNKLDLIEAKKVTVRGQVRPRPKEWEEQTAADSAAAENYNSRITLTETFGTKKSKKAVQSSAENRLLARAEDGAISNALLATMPTEEIQPNGQVDLIQESKPLPKANLTANTPDSVYPLRALVFPSEDTLDRIDVSDWQESVSSGHNIEVRSRFVVARVEAYAEASSTDDEMQQGPQSPALKRLRLLRYLLVLIEVASHLAVKGRADRGRRAIPTKQLIAQLSEPKPDWQLVQGIREHFVPADNTMRSFETQRLHTTICALALHLPSRRTLDKPTYHFAMEPSDLRDDLGVDDKTIQHYFKELGCRLDNATEADQQAFGIRKGKKDASAAGGDALKAKTHAIRIAKLRLPLKFPKKSSGRPMQ